MGVAPARESHLYRASYYLAFASAATILLSISVSQNLLWLSLLLLFWSRASLRLPRIWLPLGLFLAGTLLSLLFSPEPLHGLPQVKKMLVFTMLLAISSTMPDLLSARRLFQCWGAIACAVACLGVVQFVQRWRAAQAQHVNFYEYYVVDRVRGTMSHWMTFAGQEMVVLLMLLAFLLFGPRLRPRAEAAWWLGVALLGVVLMLNQTRTVWMGTAVGGVWLLWRWRRLVAVAAPAALLLFAWLVPGPVHDRFISIFHEKKDVDSNEFRRIAFATGARMIQAHPVLGIGLDETKYHFLDYLPPDAPNPLPSGFYQHLHNFYLQFAAERGIPTLLMLLWMLGMILYDFWQAARRLPAGRSDKRFLLNGGIAVVVGIMLSGIFEVNLGDTEVLTVFLVVVACGYLAVEGRASRQLTGAPAVSNG